VARPLEFDKDVALDAALDLFWRDGFEASTIQKLLVEMGINRGSLYSSFGDKQTLFTAALDRYEERLRTLTESTLNRAGDPLAAIRAFLEERFVAVDRNTLRNGCLLTNTISELANTEPELARLAGRKLQVVERPLLKRCQEAVAAGKIRSKLTAPLLRDYLMTLYTGLALRGKQHGNKKQLRSVIDHALASL
jgi:TetR/AcrR family transcriptional repressor of nem operon